MWREALTIVGVTVWAAALCCEFCYRYKAEGIKSPCRIARANSGYNYLFVGLPIALLFSVKTQLALGVGSTGLLAIGESACLLAVNGFEQIESMHVFFICLTWCFSTLAWLNLSWALGAVVAGPQLLLGAVVLVYVAAFRETPANNDGDDDLTTMALYWAMELCYILSNLLWMAFHISDASHDRFTFDLCAALALAFVVGLGLLARWRWPQWALWK
jgi:hypothetical protein